MTMDDKKRYNLSLEPDLAARVLAYSDEDSSTVQNALRRLIKIGLFVEDTQKTGGCVIVKNGEVETKIVIL